MSLPYFSIIIVSWNACDYLRKCLASIAETAGDLAHEVIVVDNDSEDGSPEMVKAEFPDVILIETGANLGFSKGNNEGIARSKGDYLFLINSDVEVAEGCFRQMLTFMEESPAVGLAGPRLLNTDGTHQPSCRYQPSLWRHMKRGVGITTDFADPAYRGDITRDVEVLAGSFWVARHAAVDAIGNLDERFFFYGEDIDWCMRFRAAGWRVVFHPEAVATHHGDASSRRDRARFAVELHRARLLLWRKYHGTLIVKVSLGCTFLHHALRWVYAVIAGLRPSRREEAARHRAACTDGIKWVLHHDD